MKSYNKLENIQLLTFDLIKKAQEDMSFKDQLVNNPIVTIENFSNAKVKENILIRVEDQSNDSLIFLNIPRQPNMDNLELTNEELERVSGGSTTACVATGVAAWLVCDFIDGVYNGVKDRLK